MYMTFLSTTFGLWPTLSTAIESIPIESNLKYPIPLAYTCNRSTYLAIHREPDFLFFSVSYISLNVRLWTD
jgi:hypothetical protein